MTSPRLCTTRVLEKFAGLHISPQTLPRCPNGRLLRPRHASSPIRPAAAPFSTTTSRPAKKDGGSQRDKRITLLRYHLHHPLTPRPLRFSRNRALRHWTIHRAWQLQRYKTGMARQRELERLYNSMREACEVLRTLPGDDGRLYRRAMIRQGVYGNKEGAGWPIEAGRLLTEWPAREAWVGEWRR
ncbi:MAG: hypothetical protein M1833_006423 [Piccolia ochrophora]|nr:MAG: hypothetical protein M1833_006423 [Piccolia ochrophora]